jgi:hypothetical protein
VEVAREADAQGQAAAFSIRPVLALTLGRREEADAVGSELLALGPVVVSALCTSFPTLSASAWAFRDLGREREYDEAILEPNTVDSPWVDAAQAIVDGDFLRAVAVVDGIGHAAAAAYTRLRAAQELPDEAAALVAPAMAYYRDAGATRFQRECEALAGELTA